MLDIVCYTCYNMLMIKLDKDFPLGYGLIDKFRAVFYRVFGCDHPSNMFIDLGDEDHEFWYCFKCGRKP